jgi:nucleoside-diphosphate-sugar epimerase
MAGISELATSFSRAPATLNVEKARDLLQTHWVCNPEKFENHTGFRNRVSLDEGLRATIKWYKEFGWL